MNLKKQVGLFLTLASLIGCFLGCVSSTSTTGTNEGKLVSVMQNLKETLGVLIPLVASSERYADKSNEAKIISETTKLQRLAHQIPKDAFPQDPQFAYLSAHLEEDLKLATQSYQLGQLEYSRSVLKNSISNCIGCHTSRQTGPQFEKTDYASSLEKMPAFEKAEFQTGLRQYEPALKNYIEAITQADDSWKGVNQTEKAAKAALAITVRFHSSPDESMTVADAVANKKTAPIHLKQVASQWKSDITKWKASEKDKKKPKAKNGKTLLAQAESLSSATEVGLFRRQALLTQALTFELTPRERSQVYYLMGSAIDAGKDLSWGGLSDAYYDACIRGTPHTQESEKCYDKIEDNVTLGFTGSSGVNLPPELKIKLDELKSLAKQPQ